jgi:hypothetical protein
MREAWDGEEPPARTRRAAGVRALRAAERQDLAVRRVGSLLSLLHKWTLRTCFNAQEEIYLASMDEVEQVPRRHPRIGRHIGRRASSATA